MAVDGGRCRALLARSLPSQSVPIELVKVYLFSLRSEPVVFGPDWSPDGGRPSGLGRSQSWCSNSNSGNKRFPL